MNPHEESSRTSEPGPGAQPGTATGMPGGPMPGWGAQTPPPYAPAWTPAPRRHKSVFLACLLSFLMPGLGQVYLGYYQRGFLHAVVFAGLITMLSSGAAGGNEPLFGITLAFWYLYNVVDAGRRATLINLAVDGLRAPEFPADFKLPEGRGSLIGGAILTFLGIMFFLNSRYDVNLDFLLDWWPLALVAIGVNLMYKNIKSRSK